MKKFPLYTQHEISDCGPACLKMIAEYYGRIYSLSVLREMCCISRNGVSLLGISEAAKKLGFDSVGLKFSIEQLKQEMKSPCILYWNQKHFVVLYKIKKRKGNFIFYIADPVGKKVIYEESDFKKSWLCAYKEGDAYGVLLSIAPAASFYEMKANNESERASKHNLIFLIAYLKPYKSLIFQLFLGLFVGAFFQLILPILTQSIVDYGIKEQNLLYIYLILIAQLSMTLGNAAIDFIRNWILLHIGARINVALISDYLIKLMKLPISFFDTRIVGDILQRINDHSRIQNFLSYSSLFTLFSFFNIFILGIVVFIYSWEIFFIYFLGSLFYLLWIWLFMGKRAKLDYKIFTQSSERQDNIIQLIIGMQEIKLNGCELQKRKEWEHIQAQIFQLMVKSTSLTQIQQSGALFINQIKNLIITAFVATLVVKEQMTLGMMISVQYIIGQLNGPINQLFSFSRNYQDASLSLERLKEVYLNEDEELDYIRKIIHIRHADIEIKNLSFKYEKLKKESVLADINLVIPKGKTTAIVGLSGSGKTTLLKLVLGFYKPDRGNIMLDGINLDGYNIKEWRRKCGVVMQDGYIFSDTIAKNIALGEDYIDEENLNRAADIANMKEYIDGLPLGFNTKIGADGSGLSQGQKQRILIARAVYKNPDYIFLDEATNSLDTNNEKSIVEKLDFFFKGKTAVIIAHRLSTVRYADQIVVLQSGRIKEIGKHEELLKLKGIYYNLVKNQLNI